MLSNILWIQNQICCMKKSINLLSSAARSLGSKCLGGHIILLVDISGPHIADISNAWVSLIDQFERCPATFNHATSYGVWFHFIGWEGVQNCPQTCFYWDFNRAQVFHALLRQIKTEKWCTLFFGGNILKLENPGNHLSVSFDSSFPKSHLQSLLGSLQ